jgi:hypothetical protein
MEYFTVSTGGLFAWVQTVENRVTGKKEDFIYVRRVSCANGDKI